MTERGPERSVLIIGGTSEIGVAIARRFAKDGTSIALAARSIESLSRTAEEIRRETGSRVSIHRFDVLDFDRHGEFLDGLGLLPDIVVSAVGLIGRQRELALDHVSARRVMETNFVAPSLLLEEIANRMEARGNGTIVGLSSVAGDRGRASNYTYGSAKAGFTAFLSGLRGRLRRKGVHIITVKPGFVATKMIDGLNPPRALTASTEEVAEAVANAVRKGRDVVHVKPVWRPIMLLVRLAPERVFHNFRL
jgi:short-subunit dehydrogenase